MEYWWTWSEDVPHTALWTLKYWSHSLWKQNLISSAAFLYKELGLRIEWIPLKEKDPLSITPWRTIGDLGISTVLLEKLWIWNRVRIKLTKLGRRPPTSSFSEMQPILQQITGFVVSIKATSRHPPSCVIWPQDSAYICMPSKDSCQSLTSGCLFLSGLKSVRTSSSKIRL